VLAIGGCTVAELQARMSQAEFRAWVHMYRQQPFDDLHRYHRPAALVASAMSGNYTERIRFLAPEPVPEGYSEAELRTFSAFGIKPPTRN
jgi:hypothetical protein